jgi:ABC-type antimicrobial peptide transport system permease subunit
MTEKQYYYKQSKSFSGFISILGTTISVIFSAGAIFGAMITMYASVSNRTREIGTLRALGFRRRAILLAFLTESLIISITGGIVGVALANILNFAEFSTTNFDTFSEVAFPFRMSAGIAINAIIFSVVMGFIGGFLPAVRAARFKIIDALRAT